MDKGTNTDLINITTHKDANSVEVRIYLGIEVQTMENPSALTNIRSTINKATRAYEENIIPKVNWENTTSMRNNHATEKLYRHLNHKGRSF